MSRLPTPFSRSRGQDARAVGNQSATDFAEPLQPANFIVTVMTSTTQADTVMQTLKHIRRKMAKSEVANLCTCSRDPHLERWKVRTRN